MGSLIEDYYCKDIFNANEERLFYNFLRDMTFVVMDENGHDVKLSELRLTVFAMYEFRRSEEITPLVFGKSK